MCRHIHMCIYCMYIYLPIHPSIDRSISLSLSESVGLSLSLSLSVALSLCLSVNLSIYVPTYFAVNLCICKLSVYVIICTYVYLYVYIYIHIHTSHYMWRQEMQSNREGERLAVNIAMCKAVLVLLWRTALRSQPWATGGQQKLPRHRVVPVQLSFWDLKKQLGQSESGLMQTPKPGRWA